ncbi:MAG TPA: ABC transporter ATP-binding protein [Actinomycetospora sp.]|uniref:ABC transporter ATP-binding protein n=1 Tax=Actinomycetospora sp. TaxID=1872135 RepID=UPI002F3E60EF
MSIPAIFRFFWPATRAYRGRLAAGLVLVMIGPLLDTAQIWMLKLFIDDVLVPRSFTLFPVIAAAYLALGLGQGIGAYADEWLTNWLGERFVLDLRTRLFHHLHGLSVDFFDRRHLGDTLSRLTSDIDQIEQLVLSGPTDTLAYGFQILFFAGALFYLNWQLALATLLAAPLFGLAARYFNARIKEASREQRRRSATITAAAEESLANVALVQAYHRRAAETARFHRENLARFAAEMVATRLRAIFQPLIDFLEVIGVVLVMALGLWELQQGRITLGGLLVFITYLSQLYSPVKGVGKLSGRVYAASASAERIVEVLETRPEITEPARPRTLPAPRGEISFDDVCFTYHQSLRPALTQVTLSARPGQTLAVVGASGAGKSTIGKLLLRLYDPDSGHVRLDGVDLRELSLTTLRDTVAAVLQETLVFDGTVRENLLWSRPDASEHEMIEAARAADLHEFVTELAEGYDTRVGQRGRLLSGGQRQRLTIARAMIRNPRVLLLDEPTTGLDAATRARILGPLRRLMAGRTTVVISHDLLTVADADQIVVLDGGRVTGRGTHAELLAGDPGYAELYRLHDPDHRVGPAEVPLAPPLDLDRARPGGWHPRPSTVEST